MHFIAAQFAVEKFAARSESAKRFHSPNCKATASVAESKLAGGAPALQFILAGPPQNHPPVFALRLRVRCRSHVRTRTRSRNHRRDSLRVGFSNPQRPAPWRECLPNRQAKP